MAVTIEQIREEHIEGFWNALDEVARERRFLLFLEAPPLDQTATFVRSNLERGVPQFVALEASRVVGWCDICPREREGLRHTGILGMGVISSHRGRGLGRKLLERTLAQAFAQGLTRIELEAFSSNFTALQLYRKFGFQQEGIKRKARFVDGRWDDFIVMSLLSEHDEGS